ncbi:MAG: hypothetical protein F4Z35_03560 [Dehalococcoidia bacterium]|nr:hypothetical protein [Dehalococcoidia bacterium]
MAPRWAHPHADIAILPFMAAWEYDGRTAGYVGNKCMLYEDYDDSWVANVPNVTGGYGKYEVASRTLLEP